MLCLGGWAGRRGGRAGGLTRGFNTTPAGRQLTPELLLPLLPLQDPGESFIPPAESQCQAGPGHP